MARCGGGRDASSHAEQRSESTGPMMKASSRELAELDVSNLQLKARPPRLILEERPEVLDEDVARDDYLGLST